jgi:hypothetical protein
MMARAFEFILVQGGKRTVSKIIANSSMQATCIGMSTLQAVNTRCTIICKPAKGVSA